MYINSFAGKIFYSKLEMAMLKVFVGLCVFVVVLEATPFATNYGAAREVELDIDVVQEVDVEIYEQAPDPNLMLCAKIGFVLEECVAFTNFPFCNGTKSLLQSCLAHVTAALPQCKIALITNALKQRISSLQASDAILCQNKLYQQFKSDLKCWKLAKPEMMAITRLVKGILTDDGCRIAKLNVDIIIGLAAKKPTCSNLLTSYLVPLFKQSACGKVTDY